MNTPTKDSRQTSAEFVTGFATGWPEQQPDIMVISLTTSKGVQDFAVNKEQALLDREDDQGDRGEARGSQNRRANQDHPVRLHLHQLHK